jgi:urease accessory protein
VKEIVLQHRSCRAKVRAKPGTEVETRRATSLDGRISAALDVARDERLLFKITALLAALVPAPALAHTGHAGSSFAAGLLHPLTGVDHLLAMLMVGLWAGIAFRRQWWICPAAFVCFMLAGFGYGAAGGVLPFAELLIIASLAVLSMSLVLKFRPSLGVAAPMVALFAVGHGFAHGVEIPGGDATGFAAGFMLMTSLLHAAGLAIAWRMRLRPIVMRSR